MTSNDDGTAGLESFYKIHRTHWTEAYSKACETKPSFQLRIKYAIQLAKKISARLVLDAGCGTAKLIAEFARSGIPCNGIDASTEMLAIAKAKLPPTNLCLFVATSNLLRTIQAPSMI